MTNTRTFTTLAEAEQVRALNELVEEWAVKKNKHVKGPFTTGEYVEFKLREIFGPHHWSFTIMDGPKVVEISNSQAYTQVTGRLTVKFADGSVVTQDAVGVWPLVATGGRNGTLENTAAERYETCLKAACTDALKAAAERIGSCFRPMSDLDLEEHIKRTAFLSSETKKKLDKIPLEEKNAIMRGTEEDETLTGNGSNDFKIPDQVFLPSSTLFWTWANKAMEKHKLTKPQADEIYNANTSNGQTNWAAAIDQLREKVKSQ